MGFNKGQSGNPGGRKKGTKNKSTQEMRELIHEIIASNFSKRNISADLSAMEPKYRLQFMMKLLDFVVPKPTSEQIKENSSRSSSYYLNILEQIKNSGTPKA